MKMKEEKRIKVHETEERKTGSRPRAWLAGQNRKESSMTNTELYQAVEEGKTITKEITDIMLELDTTASVTTQAELNKLLTGLYGRLAEEEIIIEAIDAEKPATQDQLAAWVETTIDPYSAKMFKESIA